MADEVDKANALADELLTRNIAFAAAHGPEVEATGVCLWCDNPLPPGHRWCDAECRDDWNKYARS